MTVRKITTHEWEIRRDGMRVERRQSERLSRSNLTISIHGPIAYNRLHLSDHEAEVLIEMLTEILTTIKETT